MNYYLILGEELSLMEVSENKEEKTIAGTNELPLITFSEEAYKDMKERFGWVDVEKEVKKYVQELIDCKSVKEHERTWISAICHQFYDNIQSLNKNRFSEEDMVEFSDWIAENKYGRTSLGVWRSNDLGYKTSELVKLWQQQRKTRRVKVEVEMEEVCYGLLQEKNINKPLNSSCSFCSKRNNFQPKISSNEIKITGLC